MSRAVCKKCLLAQLEPNDFYNRLKLYIEEFPTELRVSDDEYERRLTRCKCCKELINAMCKKCGCYVELRALKKSAHCADFPAKW